MAERKIGHTQHQGWEIGVRHTLPTTTEQLWSVLFSKAGLACWLGSTGQLNWTVGSQFQTAQGTRCEIRSFADGSLVRMRWQPVDWPTPSTVQLRVMPAKTGATLSIHHEKLPDEEYRYQMRHHWQTVIANLEKLLEISH